jgi:adenylate kinase family enzyme
MRKALNCIIMGAPGGGKGTISKKLVKDFGFIHVSVQIQSVACADS